MSLEKPEKQTPEEQNKRLEEHKAKIVEELSSFAVKHGNPLYFEDFGSSSLFANNQEIKIKDGALKGLDENERKTVENFTNILSYFIACPIFTDEFHEKHRNLQDLSVYWRYNWEQDNLSELGKEAKTYYHSNRLSGGKCVGAIGAIFILKELISDPEIKNKIPDISENVYNAFLKRDNGDETKEYDSYSDQKKIQIVRELTALAKETLDSLVEKD